jgi:hypothetical protein
MRLAIAASAVLLSVAVGACRHQPLRLAHFGQEYQGVLDTSGRDPLLQPCTTAGTAAQTWLLTFGDGAAAQLQQHFAQQTGADSAARFYLRVDGSLTPGGVPVSGVPSSVNGHLAVWSVLELRPLRAGACK